MQVLEGYGLWVSSKSWRNHLGILGVDTKDWICLGDAGQLC